MVEVLVSVVAAGLLAQGAKIVANLSRGERFSWRLIFETGGMPSSHSALVVSLTTILGLTRGIFDPLFVFSLVMAMIVIRDAVGVRRTAGLEGDLLKKLLKKHKMPSNMSFASGHTPLQVAVGSLIGVLAGLVGFFL